MLVSRCIASLFSYGSVGFCLNKNDGGYFTVPSCWIFLVLADMKYGICENVLSPSAGWVQETGTAPLLDFSQEQYFGIGSLHLKFQSVLSRKRRLKF